MSSPYDPNDSSCDVMACAQKAITVHFSPELQCSADERNYFRMGPYSEKVPTRYLVPRWSFFVPMALWQPAWMACLAFLLQSHFEVDVIYGSLCFYAFIGNAGISFLCTVGPLQPRIWLGQIGPHAILAVKIEVPRGLGIDPQNLLCHPPWFKIESQGIEGFSASWCTYCLRSITKQPSWAFLFRIFYFTNSDWRDWKTALSWN